jgi:hypothetical protein
MAATTKEFNVTGNAITVLNKTTTAAEGTAEAVKTLNKQYLELKKQQEQYKPNTAEFKALTQQMAELKKQMKESADAVAQQTTPAVEGLRGTFGTMKEQVMDFNFEGLTESLKSFTSNLSRVNVSSITGSLKAMLSAGVQGFKTLGNVIKANPIFLVAGALIGIIAYWEKLSNLVSGKGAMKQALQSQVAAYENQAKQLERINSLVKIQNKDAGQILKSELFILEVKKQQALAAYRLALLEDDTAKIAEQRNALDDANAAIAMRREQSAKSINDYYNDALQNSEKQLNSDADRRKVNQEINSKISEAMDLQIALTAEIDKQKVILEQQKKLPGVLGDPKATQNEIDRLVEERKSYTKKVFYLDDVYRKEQLDALDKAEKNRLKALNDAHQAELNARRDFELQLRNEIFKTTATQDEYEIEMLTQQYDKKKEDAKKNKADLLLVEEWYTNALSELLLSQAEREYQIDQEKNKKLLDKKKEAHDKEQELATAYNDRRNAIDNELNNAKLSAQDLELQDVRNHYLALIAEAKYFGKDAQVLIEAQKKAEAEINKKYDDENLAKQQATFTARLGLVSSGLDALGALNDAFTKRGQEQSRKQFQIQKTLNLASAVVDTYGGINRALNDKTMPSTTARIIQASIVGAMGLANVIKISKTEYGNASAPSGTNMSAGSVGGGTEAPSPANFAFLGNQPNQQQPPLQAYVVGAQVSSNLEAQQLIQNQSRLGG